MWGCFGALICPENRIVFVSWIWLRLSLGKNHQAHNVHFDWKKTPSFKRLTRLKSIRSLKVRPIPVENTPCVGLAAAFTGRLQGQNCTSEQSWERDSLKHILTKVHKFLHSNMQKYFAHSYAVSYLENLGAAELGIEFRRGESLLCLSEDMQCIHRAHHRGIELI